MSEMQTEIEILKVEMRGMVSSITQLGVKMDSMLAIQTQIVRLQEQQDNSRLAMDRAFTSIREVEVRADATEAKLTQSLSFIRGALFVSALVFSGLQWYVLKQFESVGKTNDMVVAIDRRLYTLETRVWPDLNGARK